MTSFRRTCALAAMMGSCVATFTLPGCAASVDESTGQSPEELTELRTAPTARVSTADSAVQVLSGYNAFLDKALSQCVAAEAGMKVQLGNVDGSYYVKHVTSKDELAKELDIDITASVKSPAAAEANGAVRVLNSFKQNATTVTFVVRAFRTYEAIAVPGGRSDDIKGHLSITPEAARLVQADPLRQFMNKCGGSFINAVRYQAQVVGLMQFQAKTIESAQSIEAELGGGASGIAKSIANASADVKGKAQNTATTSSATMTLDVIPIGFVPKVASSNVADNTFEKMDALRADMEAAVQEDYGRDLADYFGNKDRKIRPVTVTQASYTSVSGAPAARYDRVIETLNRAEQFFEGVAMHAVRAEKVYRDELQPFLQDHEQYRYNLWSQPKRTTGELMQALQQWSNAFSSDGEAAPGSLVAPIRMAVARCTSLAGVGSYEACTTDPVLDGQVKALDDALDKYGQTARVVRLVAEVPRANVTMSYRNAESECSSVGLRLPKRNELPFIAPFVQATANPSGATAPKPGEVWFAADARCAKPFFANGNGQADDSGCATGLTEALPYVGDRPVVCVGRGGPVPVTAAP